MKLSKNRMQFTAMVISAVFLFPVSADTIVTTNGSNLVGQVTVITNKSVTMETEYAGTIMVDTDQISKLLTDTPLSTKLEDGSMVTGITEINDQGYITVENASMNMSASMDKLLASWMPDNKPPEEAGFPQDRHWHYNVGADFNGKKGNSKETGTSVRAEANLVSDVDELKFYLSVDRADSDGEKTSDEIIFGSSYVSYFSDTIGWFVRSELERDPFESIDLRASVSGGMSYWLFHQPEFSLELQAGLGYRHEAFNDDTNEDTPTLDLRINNNWQVNSWMNMINTLAFTPSLTNFNDFLLVQDSSMSMPIGSSRWTLRLGLENNYKNEPALGRKKLDTTYYSRLLLNFY